MAGTKRAAKPRAELVSLSGKLTRIFVERGNWFSGQLVDKDNNRHSINGAITNIPPVGSDLSLMGSWQTSEKYGQQFKFENCAVTLPSTKEGVVRYLMQLPHVGKSRAEKIFDTLGSDCVKMIVADVSVLASVPGFEKYAEGIGAGLRDRLESMDNDLRMCNMGFGGRTREKIIEKFGDRLTKVLRCDPYALVAVDRVSFRAVDDAVMPLKEIAPDDEYRSAAAIVQALRDASEEGHTWLTAEQLGEALNKLGLTIPVPTPAVEPGIARAVRQETVRRVGNGAGNEGFALTSLADAEDAVAARLLRLMATSKAIGKWDNVPADVAAMLKSSARASITPWRLPLR